MNSFIKFITVPFILTIIIENANSIALRNNSELSTNSPNDLLPPLIFPNDENKFRILPTNPKIISRLLKSEQIDAIDADNKMKLSSSSSSERKRRTRSTTDLPEIEKIISNQDGTILFRVKNMHVDDVPEVFPKDLQNLFKNDVEEVQSDDLSHPETELEERFKQPEKSANVKTIFEDIDIEMHSTKQLNNIHLSVIFGTIIFILCVGIYIGYLTWRYQIQKRYGRRERLMTEDSFSNSNGEIY